ncbi:hypothetical protein E2C01_036894 [Portunus trituberculatus]|uniref:Uncharacterized protein n=1 Tax=Portunus trituberculatus TaxID=210409 RepID=A0A5B7F9Y4_PORTR|nr:hypothetical protein [Portunus trituberculatus]
MTASGDVAVHACCVEKNDACLPPRYAHTSSTCAGTRDTPEGSGEAGRAVRDAAIGAGEGVVVGKGEEGEQGESYIRCEAWRRQVWSGGEQPDPGRRADRGRMTRPRK